MSATPGWLRTDLSQGTQLLVIEPLFEEANRCRRMICDILRRLDRAGITTSFAALPATGESLADILTVRMRDWRATVSEAPQPLVASFRGGALIDDAGPPRPVWRFAPETGARIVRDLRRTTLTGGDDGLLAGHRLSGTFVAELEAASPVALTNARTVRLESDGGPADLKVPGVPLWRRAEPGEDEALSDALADDLIGWVRSCAVS